VEEAYYMLNYVKGAFFKEEYHSLESGAIFGSESPSPGRQEYERQEYERQQLKKIEEEDCPKANVDR